MTENIKPVVTNKNLTICKTCNQEIAKSVKVCPGCGAKNKKPLHKKWWFWIIIALIFISVITPATDNDTEYIPAQAIQITNNFAIDENNNITHEPIIEPELEPEPEEPSVILLAVGSRNPLFRRDAADIISFEPISFTEDGLNYTLIGGLWSTLDGGGNISLDLDLSDHISQSMAIGFSQGLASRRMGNRDRLLRLYFEVEVGETITSPRDIPSVRFDLNLVDNTGDRAISIHNSIDRGSPMMDAPLRGVLVFGLYSDAEWIEFDMGGSRHRLPLDIMVLSR